MTIPYLRTLYLEDDRDQFLLLEQALENLNSGKVKVFHVETIEQAKQIVMLSQFDFFLVDYLLSDSPSAPTGLDFIAWLREIGANLPVLLFTNHPDVDFQGHEDLLASGLEVMSKDEISPERMEEVLLRTVSRPVKVLVVDDDPDDCSWIERCLDESELFKFDVSKTYTVHNAENLICEGDYSVVIMDYMFGAKSSTPFINEILNSNIDLSVVLVTDSFDLGSDESALRLLGRRKITYLSKTALNTSSLVHAINASRCKLKASGQTQL